MGDDVTYKPRWNRERQAWEMFSGLVRVASFSKYSEAEAWALSPDVDEEFGISLHPCEHPDIYGDQCMACGLTVDLTVGGVTG